MEDRRKELQLLPLPPSSYSPWPTASDLFTFRSSDDVVVQCPLDPPSLDLQLSISLRPMKPPPPTVKWRTSDQIAAMEKAYVERVMEMTRREMEMAQSEFARARHTWERAREEVERVEKMKERATRQLGSCLEITCQGCRKKFKR
ncbi:protein SHOOT GRAVITROPISM 5-like [Cynara cardunculus var. scolymus]|uniref:Protein SHOOT GRAVITROPISM 5 n=1 Tax=Cynara cardunculus var. scolymus TaxID=59895 RepID=A0A103XY61_CYNCS|nr:protein SHOOT GRAVITROPISM 5-like [Cynara cardunculus var. scolymus]KVH99004.1 hypothetical protein Ccrd_022777 [Cynara cardunculus var. scolymus]